MSQVTFIVVDERERENHIVLESMPFYFYRRANAKVSSINHVESGPDKNRLDGMTTFDDDELSTLLALAFH
jgi:hypothetical protein